MRVFLNKEGREIIKKGIDLSVNTIKTTLGGAGKTCVIYSGGIVGITKDGQTVARNIILEGDDNIGATIIRSSADKQLSDSGDGTTLVSLLTQKIIEYGFECIDRKVDQMELKRGIDMSVEFITKELNAQSEIVGDDNNKIKNIATISANNDNETGALIAEAFKQIGNDGDLFIEESKTVNTSIRVDEGFVINRGYLSPLFCNPETMEAELLNPYILFYDGKIDKFAQLKPVLDGMMKAQKREILIICDNMEGEALQTLAVNRMKGVLNVVVVNAPYFGDRRKHSMEDMAALTNGVYISVEKGIKDFDLTHCGTCDKVLVTKNDCTIIGGKSEEGAIEKIVSQIDALISQSQSDFETEWLKTRKARVKGKLGIISVGAPTETEMKEKKERIEDSIRSVKCAIESGTLPGGGIALFRCIEKLKELKTSNEFQKMGVEVISKSIEAPLRQILENAGIDNKDEIISEILTKDRVFGFNVKTGKIENMLEAGVIDATKVVTTALVNAASVAGTIITAESLIC